jgi:hypothetical protein
MGLVLVSAASVAIWLYLLFGRGGFWRMRGAPPNGTLPAGPPSVVAVIPARNEAPVVAQAVASLAAQRYPAAFHIILADDDSSDGTADAARTAAAAGGCILIRRQMLERIGGIATIRGQLIDDCALARAVQQAGGRVWLGLSPATRSIRAYARFAEIGLMISRTAFTQLGHSTPLLLATALSLGLTYLAPPALTLLAPPGAARGLAAIAWLLMSIAYWPALRYYARPAWWAPGLPLVAAFYLGATLHSALAYWRGVGGEWKGRVQDADSNGPTPASPH